MAKKSKALAKTTRKRKAVTDEKAIEAAVEAATAAALAAAGKKRRGEPEAPAQTNGKAEDKTNAEKDSKKEIDASEPAAASDSAAAAAVATAAAAAASMMPPATTSTTLPAFPVMTTFPILPPLVASGGGDSATSGTGISTPLDPEKIVWSSLLTDSPLVFVKDRGLVPDSLLVSMGQLRPCSLTIADKVGSYAHRPIGFTGICCQFCGGRPGHGRFFPASMRSLAQTTTSKTIIKHIASKCRFCPEHIRTIVVELEKIQAKGKKNKKGAGDTDAGGIASSNGDKSGTEQDASAAAAAVAASIPSRPQHGSRKVFFQRVWTRLHGSGGTPVAEATASGAAKVESGTDNNEGAQAKV